MSEPTKCPRCHGQTSMMVGGIPWCPWCQCQVHICAPTEDACRIRELEAENKELRELFSNSAELAANAVDASECCRRKLDAANQRCGRLQAEIDRMRKTSFANQSATTLPPKPKNAYTANAETKK